MPDVNLHHKLNKLDRLTLRLLLSTLLQYPYAKFAVEVDYGSEGSTVFLDEPTYNYMRNILNT